MRLAEELRARNAGATRCIAAFAVLDRPPSLAAGEVTDKGYVNQRAVLPDLVDILYAADPPRASSSSRAEVATDVGR